MYDLDFRLAFEGGDVIFHTSQRPSGIFVLHKSVLEAKLPYFRSILSPSWGRKSEVLAPGGPSVYQLDLELDTDTGFGLPRIRVSAIYPCYHGSSNNNRTQI
jgi:hypothetical protein